MDLINLWLDLVVPPTGLFFLAFCYPAIAFFQFWSYIFRTLFPQNVQGKVVLITGASSGIGEHIAYQYARRGARLMLVARREKMLRDVADRCRRIGALHVHVAVADVTKEADVSKFVDQTINQFGHLDHLVCNAGVTSSFFFEDIKDPAVLTQVLDVTFWGTIYTTYYALPHLKRSRGKILANASVAAWLPLARMSIYNAANAGVVQFFDTLRVEVGSKVGITILQPGAAESEMLKGNVRLHMLPDAAGDTQFGAMDVAETETIAKAAVKGVLRGDRYVVAPPWYSVLLLYRILVPEFLTYWFRVIYVTKVDNKRYSSKALMETLEGVPGAKRALFPESIKSS